MNPNPGLQARHILDFESVLQQLIEEHRKLLKHVEAQQAAMKALDLNAMDQATRLQESARLRIISLDARRRSILQQIAKLFRVVGEPKIAQLVEFYPHRKAMLLRLKNELKSVLDQLASKNYVAGRVAGAVLGHLNHAVRLIAGAVENAGLYTRRGVPQSVKRVGLMEAVG